MTILNRAILAIMLWTTLGAGTAMSSIVQPLVNTDWVAENLDNEKAVSYTHLTLPTIDRV